MGCGISISEMQRWTHVKIILRKRSNIIHEMKAVTRSSLVDKHCQDTANKAILGTFKQCSDIHVPPYLRRHRHLHWHQRHTLRQANQPSCVLVELETSKL